MTNTEAEEQERSSLLGYYSFYKFNVTRVISGDTVEGIVDLGFNVFSKQRFRLAGIIAPSFRIKEDVDKAKAAKMWLQSRLNKESVTITCYKNKFGKYLATLFAGGSNINLELLTAGHAIIFKKVGRKELAGLARTT